MLTNLMEENILLQLPQTKLFRKDFLTKINFLKKSLFRTVSAWQLPALAFLQL